jgi:hypothetical protein
MSAAQSGAIAVVDTSAKAARPSSVLFVIMSPSFDQTRGRPPPYVNYPRFSGPAARPTRGHVEIVWRVVEARFLSRLDGSRISAPRSAPRRRRPGFVRLPADRVREVNSDADQEYRRAPEHVERGPGDFLCGRFNWPRATVQHLFSEVISDPPPRLHCPRAGQSPPWSSARTRASVRLRVVARSPRIARTRSIVQRGAISRHAQVPKTRERRSRAQHQLRRDC